MSRHFANRLTHRPFVKQSHLQTIQGRSFNHTSPHKSNKQREADAELLLYAGPPGSANSPADTHQKFMAALAKAALAQVWLAGRCCVLVVVPLFVLVLPI